MRFGPLTATLAATLLLSAAPLYAQSLPWMNTALPPDQRAALLVSAMTLDQKIQQIAMNPVANTNLPGCTFSSGGRHIEGIPSLAIPTVRMINGPAGVSGGDCGNSEVVTALPTEFVNAASFDPSVWSQWGTITAQEARAWAYSVVLGPGMDMGRIPNGGRNFEYLGEDPLLTGSAATAIVQAIQAQGVISTAKHYVANEQETQRQTMNVVVDDRTLHELYLLPFEMVVKDGPVASLMCSYPRVNGTYSCQNAYILSTVLGGQWGFPGYVMSDRGATQSTVPSIQAGLDLELATPNYFSSANIKAALAAGQIVVSNIDAMLIPRYYEMLKLGQFDNPINSYTSIDYTTHGLVARTIAEQGSVLLQNQNGALPLKAQNLRGVAVIGATPFAGIATIAGNGPGRVPANAEYTVTPQTGLQNVLSSLGSSATVTFNDGTNTASAVALAASSDVAIVMAGDLSAEGSDRSDLLLPVVNTVDQNALISAVAAANPNTIVVLKNGGPVLMPWLNQVPAVLEAWYPGQEDGNAVADLLFGVTNPSGKLPITFPSLEREAATATVQQWPGVTVNGILTATYSEQLDMGYRWYDANGVNPLFPFGYGLSYTTFSITNVNVSPSTASDTNPITVHATVTNTGQRAGAEVVQVYLGLPPASGEPPKRLVGFQKVFLNPGQSQAVTITINPNASNHPLGIWDTGSQSWVSFGGALQVDVGNSAANIVSSTSITVQHLFGRVR